MQIEQLLFSCEGMPFGSIFFKLSIKEQCVHFQTHLHSTPVQLDAARALLLLERLSSFPFERWRAQYYLPNSSEQKPTSFLLQINAAFSVRGFCDYPRDFYLFLCILDQIESFLPPGLLVRAEFSFLPYGAQQAWLLCGKNGNVPRSQSAHVDLRTGTFSIAQTFPCTVAEIHAVLQYASELAYFFGAKSLSVNDKQFTSYIRLIYCDGTKDTVYLAENAGTTQQARALSQLCCRICTRTPLHQEGRFLAEKAMFSCFLVRFSQDSTKEYLYLAGNTGAHTGDYVVVPVSYPVAAERIALVLSEPQYTLQTLPLPLQMLRVALCRVDPLASRICPVLQKEMTAEHCKSYQRAVEQSRCGILSQQQSQYVDEISVQTCMRCRYHAD